MEAWARSIPGAQFLCVCVESKQVAVMFHNWFAFRDVVNGFIPSREYMPRGYGQLGCSGFIISDKDGCFVSRRTKAFLQVDKEAFRNVERILAPMLAVTPAIKEDEKKEPPKETVTGLFLPTKPVQVDSMKPPASVGVDSMDAEHEECTKALNKALSKPSPQSVEYLYEELKSHFDHEEKLMSQYFGQPNGDSSTTGTPSFSKLDSHRMDHERILNIAKNELDRLKRCCGPVS